MSLRETATQIVRRLHKAGFEAYWVGGCVRDFLLGREPDDYDIATSARPEQVEELFTKTIPVGRQFGVVLVLEQGHEFQVATFRAERDYADGRRPSHVEFASARADAERRDFSVNGLFFDPVANQLHDWVGGEADLKERRLRTIGKPEDRFGEDHLRLLRAIRLGAQLDFEIESATFAAVRQLASKVANVSAERIRDELMKLFRPPHAARGLELLHESSLMGHVLPELLPTLTCDQSPEHHPEGTVFNHIRLMLSKLPPDAHESLAWGVLLHDIAKPQTASRDPNGTIHFYGHERIGADMAEGILQRLRFSRRQMDEIVQCVRFHMQFKDAPQMRRSTLKRMLLRPTFPLELALHRLDCLGSIGRLDTYQFLVEEQEALRRQPAIIPPLLTGDDLLQLGVEPGPKVGALLREIRDLQLEGELHSREEAISWTKESLSGN